MGTNTITNMKLCFFCEKRLRVKNFRRLLKSNAHAIKTAAKVLCEIGKEF